MLLKQSKIKSTGGKMVIPIMKIGEFGLYVRVVALKIMLLVPGRHWTILPKFFILIYIGLLIIKR